MRRLARTSFDGRGRMWQCRTDERASRPLAGVPRALFYKRLGGSSARSLAGIKKLEGAHHFLLARRSGNWRQSWVARANGTSTLLISVCVLVAVVGAKDVLA